ncbi:PAS domain S-box protein [Xanthomarina sp. F1114]|uniref:PAS domain S-box protein n=1 Tax=Xanthomarina sp. F1114 TaxID=2996019 RepID=UPI00225DD3B1|nr:PAS domain S-box protein [Xanthomarina sp. F1114]MCX7546717.1 PAS domain S-box protein [Xanthomarina sp. F1114]
MLKSNQDVFEILSEAISEGIVIVDANQDIVALNSTAETIFGYPKGELLGQPLNTLIPVHFHENHGKYFNKFFNHGKKRSMGEDRILHGLKKDGSTFPIEVGLNPFTIEGEAYVMALVIDISTRLDIEKSLHIKSQALQFASNGIVITDALQKDHPIIYANTAFEKLSGYSQEEILNQNCRFLQAHDKDQKNIKKLKTALKKGNSCQTILRNYRKDGSMFWNELSITPIKNNLGVITHFVGIQNDVTERKLAKENQAHLATILDESLNEIYVFDSESLRFLNANYGALKNLDYTLEELKAITPVDIKPDFNLQDFQKQIDALLRGKVDKLEFETRHIRKNGSIYPVEVHLQMSNFEDKEVFVAVILDITERKKQDLFKSKQNHILESIVLDVPLQTILNDVVCLIEEQSQDVFISLLLLNEDKQTLQTLVAPNIPDSYGRSLEELLGNEFVDANKVVSFLKKEIVVSDIENNDLWKDYKHLVLPLGLKSCWTIPIVSSKNSVLGVFAIYRKEKQDFSDLNKQVLDVGNKLAGIAIEKHLTNSYIENTQKQLENYAKDLKEQVEEQTHELQEALKNEKELNELKTKFLSLVSHEFKTPLSGILTSAMLLKKYTLEDQQDKRDKHINTISNIVNNLNNILNDFLSVEKLESGRVSYQFKTFKLSKVLNEVVYNSNMLLKDGQKIKYPENIDELSMLQDERVLDLTLSNIIHNAIKYSPENSNIAIEVTQDELVTVFQIRDEGVGIPKDDQKNIFNRYFRAENVLTTQGTGIGLNIVKSHIENLGGTISFTSKQNIGSIFTITLPNRPLSETPINF